MSMIKSKVITICGSLRFENQMRIEAERLELDGCCVLTVIYPTKESYSLQEIACFNKLHKQKIEMSDAIFVVNVDGYIGESTQNEIAYAKSMGREVIYLESIN